MRARFPSAVALVCPAACGGKDVGLFTGPLDGTGIQVLDGGATSNMDDLQVDDKYIYYMIDGRLTRRPR